MGCSPCRTGSHKKGFLKVLREEWDILFLVVAIGLILGWAVFVALFPMLSLAQTAPRAIVTSDPLLGAMSYVAKRSTSADGAQVSVGTATITAILDQTIEPTTKYWFWMAGVNELGEGASGPAVNNPFRFSDIQPASPANVTCTQTKRANKVTLNCNWGVVTKTRSLLLLPAGAIVSYRAFLANTGTVQTFTVLNGTSIQIADLPRHQTFYFYVTAVWNEVESLGSPANRQQT